MNYTILNVSFREHSRYRLTEPCEVICAGNEDILDLSIFQIIQHGSPEFRAFILADPHSEHRFPAFKIDAYRYVNSFFHYLTFTANVVMYCVHEHYRIHAFKRSLLFVVPDSVLAAWSYLP